MLLKRTSCPCTAAQTETWAPVLRLYIHCVRRRISLVPAEQRRLLRLDSWVSSQGQSTSSKKREPLENGAWREGGRKLVAGCQKAPTHPGPLPHTDRLTQPVVLLTSLQYSLCDQDEAYPESLLLSRRKAQCSTLFLLRGAERYSWLSVWRSYFSWCIAVPASP